MSLNFMEFEIPLLKALVKFGGKAKPAEIYPEVEKTMRLNPTDFPEEYEKYKSNAIKWKNKTACKSTEGLAIDIRHIHSKRHPTKRINGQSDVRGTHCSCQWLTLPWLID